MRALPHRFNAAKPAGYKGRSFLRWRFTRRATKEGTKKGTKKGAANTVWQANSYADFELYFGYSRKKVIKNLYCFIKILFFSLGKKSACGSPNVAIIAPRDEAPS